MEQLVNLIRQAENWEYAAARARDIYLARLHRGIIASGNIVELKRKLDEAQKQYEVALKELGAYVLEHRRELGLVARPE